MTQIEGVSLLTIRETCKHLAISRSSLYLLFSKGELESVRLGRTRRVPIEAIRLLVSRRRASCEVKS
jgi:excisionase family DNA binding protein